MSITVEAVYENGVLKPAEPLPLQERERVQVTVQPLTSPLLAAYGIIGYRGDPQTLRQLATGPEFGILESP
jgi:predicted DNA-binding antitoxin AbrB/MazE fold protein